MKIFTYKNYIECIHKLRLNAVLQLAEEGIEYKLETKEKRENNNAHDKLIKTILTNRSEMAKIINTFLQPKEQIDENSLVKCNNSYITKKFRSKEADIVYKLNNKDIYFLVEHQSKVDNTMPFRILNYCIDIIQEWSKNKKVKKLTRYPIVVPIVIYTGESKWKVSINFKDKQIATNVFDRYKIDIEYNLIDINKLTEKFLLEQDTMFGYAMMLEKSKNKKELGENLTKIIKNTNDVEKLTEIANIILYLLNNTLEHIVENKILSEISKKVGDDNMSTLYERILAENKELLRRGKKAGTEQVAINMLSMELDDETILEATKLSREELEKIKSNLLSV